MTNAKDEKTDLFYDLNGNTTKVLFADGTSETYHYNELNQMVRQYDRVGLETTYKYDSVGNVTEAKQPSNKVYTYEYDANYNLVKETDPLGGETTYRYDDAGNAISVTDPMGNVTQIVYNNASMIERVVDASGITSLTVDYSILGEVVQETDALSNVTRYAYDELSRLISVTDPLERVTSYTYDGADNIVSVIDGNNNAVNYEYNTKGMLTKETDALGNVEQYEYFVDGLLEQITKADGTSSNYAYDLAGRMESVNYSDETAIEYGYNEVGTTTTMVDKTGTTSYQYDDMQRLISTTDSLGKTVEYTYDILGRKTSITTPDNLTTNYAYDAMNRLVEVNQSSEVLAEYEYNANSQLISNVRDDITSTYEYNQLGQIETLTTSKLQENIMQFEYEYDKIGNIIGETRTEKDSENVRKYVYDTANQLTSFTDNDYEEVYTYDNVGNMLTKGINEKITNYSYNVGNQLTEEITNGQTIGYIYNANGDLTEKTTGENYTYDIQGNLTAIVGNGLDKQYTYNGNGNRLSETTDGETIFYVNDINRRYEEVLQTYGEDGKVINSYTYGVQRINSVGQDNETYLYDGRGSVVGSVSDGVITSYAYTAYGSLMPDSPEPKVFGYNGEATDFGSGIQYLRARYYDSTINRFFQEDDYKGNYSNPISMNRYIYCEGNPVMGTDPSGYRPIDHGPVVVIPKPVSAYDAKMAQIEKIIEDGFVNDSGATSPQQEVGSNGVPNSINMQNASEIMDEYDCGKSDEEEYWIGDKPLFSATISDDETTVTSQIMIGDLSIQGLAGIDHTEFEVYGGGSENPEGHINFSFYNNKVYDEYPGLPLAVTDWVIDQFQQDEDEFSVSDYIDGFTSFESGAEIKIFGAHITAGSTGLGVQMSVGVTNRNGETADFSVGFDTLDAISISKTVTEPVGEDGYTTGRTDQLEINTGVGVLVYYGGAAMVGLLAKMWEEMAKGGYVPAPQP